MSFLSAFTTQVVNFFEELTQTIPEEKDVKMALEAVKGAKKINPRLIYNLFYEHLYVPLKGFIERRDVEAIVAYGKAKATQQYNEIMPAIAIFDKHWPTLSVSTQEAIWQYLKVLCVLCEKISEQTASTA
jgi:hypothetical protein